MIIPTEKNINLILMEMDIQEALLELSMVSNIPIVVDDTLSGIVSASVENKDFDSVDRLLNVLSEMRQSEHELDSRSLRMLVARAEAFRWTQVLDHPTVSEYKSKISDGLLSSDDIF